MPKPLDARITAAMGNGARAATVAELIAELSSAIESAQTEQDRLDALSKSATASEDEADAAADDAAKFSRKIIRLNAKRAQLQERHEALMSSERRRRATEEHAAVKQRRDALIEDLRREMPGLIGAVVTYLERIEASEAECAILNRSREYGAEWLDGAEALARGCPGNFRIGAQDVPRLTALRIPGFEASTRAEAAWPKPVNLFAAQQELAEQQKRAKIAREAEEAGKWQRYAVTPPDGFVKPISVETQNGRKTLQRNAAVFVMSSEQAERARRDGCNVKAVAANVSIGLPAGVSAF